MKLIMDSENQAIKIMIDTNIYDELYRSQSIFQILIAATKSGIIEIYSTPIQEAEIRANLKPEDEDKREWSLRFHKITRNIPSLFSFDVEGAGFDQGRWASPEEIEQYNQIKANSSQHHKDRNLAVVAKGQMDIFVTNNIRDYPKGRLGKVKIMSWIEFVDLLGKIVEPESK